ncbi:MAG: OmpA family protein [Gammaproteobacteria bacterium]|jgi:OOP family OmpA-OmpF porin
MSARRLGHISGYGIVAAITMTVSAVAAAVETEAPPGYVVDSSGTVVRSSDGSCVRTSDWEPEMVLEQCDPELYARLYPEPEPVAPVEIAAVVPATVAVEETLDVQTLFGFDQATLDPQAKGMLDELADRLDRFTAIDSVRIAGFTDRIGSEEYNLALSKERAAAVAAFLKENTQISPAKFEVEGLGQANPIEACDGLRGSALIECLRPNRRVEVEITAERTQTTPGTY